MCRTLADRWGAFAAPHRHQVKDEREPEAEKWRVAFVVFGSDNAAEKAKLW